MIVTSAAYTSRHRRRTNRTAPWTRSRSCSLGRSCAASAAIEPSRLSTCSTASSTSGSDEESREARQSGSRLKVTRSVGQRNRATRQGGFTRSYGVCRLKPQPPSGCRGHDAKLACSQNRCDLYSSADSWQASRNCTPPRPGWSPPSGPHLSSRRTRGSPAAHRQPSQRPQLLLGGSHPRALRGSAPGAGATEALALGARPRRTPAASTRSPSYATKALMRPRPSIREATAGGS